MGKTQVFCPVLTLQALYVLKESTIPTMEMQVECTRSGVRSCRDRDKESKCFISAVISGLDRLDLDCETDG